MSKNKKKLLVRASRSCPYSFKIDLDCVHERDARASEGFENAIYFFHILTPILSSVSNISLNMFVHTFV